MGKARIEVKNEFAGSGCLIQGLALLLPFIGSLAGPIGIGLGLIVAVPIFLVGNYKSGKYVCGNCKNPVDSRAVKICPACHAELGR